MKPSNAQHSTLSETPPPPYPTDLAYAAYEDQPVQPQPRTLRQPATDPSDRTSPYNLYDDSPRHGGVHQQHQNSSPSTAVPPQPESQRSRNLTHPQSQPQQQTQQQQQQQRQQQRQPSPPQYPPQSPVQYAQRHQEVAVASPRPGYAAPTTAFNLSAPAPVVTRQHSNMPPPQLSPSAHALPPYMPAAPHPLQPSQSPISPAFARAPTSSPRNIQFASDASLMRGNTEESLIPKWGHQKDDFWRRFSMVAKDKSISQESPWLKKTRDGNGRLHRLTWFAGVFIFISAVAAISYAWWRTRNSPAGQRQAPKSIDSSANASRLFSTVVHSSSVFQGSTSHPTPTKTVARRDTFASAPAMATLGLASVPLRLRHTRLA